MTNIETTEVAERAGALIRAIAHQDLVGDAVVAMIDGLNRVDAFRCWYAATTGVVVAAQSLAAHSLTCACGGHGSTITFLVLDDDGHPLAVDDAPPAKARVGRFIAASGNHDTETAWALFLTVNGAEEISEFCALLTHALKGMLPELPAPGGQS